MNVQLSDDQLAAFELVMEKLTQPGQVVTLTGPAGSGKTTLLRTIIDEVRSSGTYVVLGAPTGKAALRLKQITESPADTLHRLLYGRPTHDPETDRPIFTDPSPPCLDGDTVILDEASMIGAKLYEEFQSQMPKTSSILYVGDKEQLAPVKDTWGPDLENATATLTEVHRQAVDNPILEYATWVREGRGDQWTHERYNESDPRVQAYEGIESAHHWLVKQRKENADATLLTFTHNTRQWLNNAVRETLGLDGAPISVGDRLVVRVNHKYSGLRNGEIVTVTKVNLGALTAEVWLEEFPLEPLIIRLDHIEADAAAHFRWKNELWESSKRGEGNWDMAKRTLHVHYGQCLTVHSSQGSQWEKVGFVWDDAYTAMKRRDPAGSRRLLYTAVTRAAQSLVMVMA